MAPNDAPAATEPPDEPQSWAPAGKTVAGRAFETGCLGCLGTYLGLTLLIAVLAANSAQAEFVTVPAALVVAAICSGISLSRSHRDRGRFG